jgi:hypothetical protein
MMRRRMGGCRLLALVAVALPAVAGCAQLPQTASVAIRPVPAQEARIWFYRDLDPHGSQATPYVRLNGTAAGVSRPGGAFYRDVPPGHYHITADSFLTDPIQTRDIDLAPGQEAFVKVLSLDNWIDGFAQDAGSGYHRDTFYVWLMPQESARPQIAKSAFYAGGALMAAVPAR